MHKVIMVCRKRDPRFFSIETVFERVRMSWSDGSVPEVIELPEYGLSIRNILFLYRIRRANPDALFHVTGDAHYCVLALPRSRTILTIHDCVFLDLYTGVKRWILKVLMLSLPVRHLHYVTTISQKTKDEVVRNTGCDGGKIRVIGNPVSSLIYYRERKFNEICPVLLFLGVTPNKNLERVCKAIESIPCVLRVVGNLTSEQKEYIGEFKIQFQSVHGITESEIADEYAEADIVLFPSLYEGFGLPLIEGFKAGRCVVTSNISPMKDIALNAAVLVDPMDVGSIRDGILRVLGNPMLRDEMIRKGFEIVKLYSPEIVAKEYGRVYADVTSQS